MPWLKIKDREFFYQCHGEGPNLLYLGGSYHDLRQSPDIFDSPLGERFTLLNYDQRGQGRTHPPSGDWSMADYAWDAARFIKAMGWNRALVMGFSFGGMVAQELAINHPDLVSRLVICAAGSGGQGGSSYPLEEFSGLEPAELAGRLLNLEDIRHDQTWEKANPDDCKLMREHLLDCLTCMGDGPDSRLLAARAKHDTFARLPEIKPPVLVAGGEYDGICPPANLDALAGNIPGAELRMFRGGHYFLEQDPTAWPALMEFLAG